MIRGAMLLLLLAALLAGPALAAGQAPVSLSMAEAIRLAGVSAPGVSSSAARVAQADAQLRQARAALLPKLGITTSYVTRSYNLASQGLPPLGIPGVPERENRVGPFDIFDTRLLVSQPLLDPAARRAVRAAASGAAAGRAEQEVVGEAVAARAAHAYAQAIRARRVEESRSEDVALARELVRLAREQTAAGAATPLDVTRAETQLLGSRSDSLEAAQAAATAAIELARVLGAPLDTRYLLTDPLAPLGYAEAFDAEASVELGLATRPELALERARLATHVAALETIHAERLPRLDLVVDAGVNGTGSSNLLPTGEIRLQLSAPVLDGWRRGGRLDEQRALAGLARAQELDLGREVEAEVRAALRDLAAARERQALSAERTQLAERELSEARVQFREGVAGNAEVVQAQRALAAARDALIAAEYQAAASRIRLAEATGTAHDLR